MKGDSKQTSITNNHNFDVLHEKKGNSKERECEREDETESFRKRGRKKEEIVA
jgi:hypothetical protein